MADMLSELLRLQRERNSTPLFSDSKGIAAGMPPFGVDIHSPVDLTEEGPGGSFSPDIKSPVDLSSKDLPPFSPDIKSPVDLSAPPPGPGNFTPKGISSMLDLKKLGVDLDKAAKGDRDARARVDYVRQNAPLVSDLTKPKPKTTIKSLPAGRDMSGLGLSAAVLPAARDLTSEGVIPAELPAPKPAGGGGVEVPAQEKQPRDWNNLLMGLGVGLTDIGNALGNERSPIQTGGYEMAKRGLQEQQMQQLKMRHDMWSDAYTQAQQLPAEVMTSPEFASLAQAKQALEKDMMDGKVDNEKNVSTFLTELARHKGNLSKLDATLKGQQAAAADEAKLTAEATRRSDLEARAAAGDAKAATALAMLGPTKQQLWEEEQKRRQADDARLAEDARWRHEDRLTMLEDRRLARGDAAQARRDALDDRAAGRRGQYITSSFENAILHRLPDRKTLSEMDPAEAEKLVGNAQRQALVEITPRLISAAQAAGLRVTVPNENDVTVGFTVNGQLFENEEKFAEYLLGQLGG